MEAALLTVLLLTHPNMDVAEAKVHITAAQEAEEEGIDTALLLALAWYESGWTQMALAYQECVPKKKCKRKSKRQHDEDTKPKHAQAPMYCGALQIGTRSWERCRELLTDLDESYRAAVAQLKAWSGYCARKKGRLECALRGYHGGFKMLPVTTDRYPKRVLALAERFRAHARRGLAWNSAVAPASSTN